MLFQSLQPNKSMEKNFLLNSNLINFIPKKNYLSFSYIILGILTPWPIFFDLRSFSIIFIDFQPMGITSRLDAVPVPIGVISISIYILILLIRTQSLFFIIRSSIFYLLILTPTLIGFDLIRIPILITPIIFLIILKRLVRIKYVPNDGFAIGYLIGLFLIYFLNIFSYLYLSFNDQNFLSFYYGKQIFGYEIWQFYLTYSAVASLVCGLSFLYLKDNFKVLKKFSIFFILLIFSSLICSSLSLRKAAFLDLIIINIILLKDFLFNLKFSKISKVNLFILIISLLGFLISGNILQGARSIIDTPRINILIKFISILNDIDIFSFLFGIDRGSIGGYSSLFIELFVRNGFIGFVVYFSVLCYLLFSYIKNLFSIPNLPKSSNSSLIFFVLFSALIGNLVNLNFATPYYSINFGSVLIVIYSIDCTARLRKLKKLIKSNFHYNQ